MDRLKELRQLLETQRPEEWRDFPDINLYKDQVVGYLKRQLVDPAGDGVLTPAMISNYIKDKLLPKAEGKKYNRQHLALLTEIGMLKQVLPVRDIEILLKANDGNKSPDEIYKTFTQLLDLALSETAAKIDPDIEREDLHDLALKFAVESYCNRLVCVELLSIIGSQEESGKSKSKNSKSKAENSNSKMEKE